LEELPGTSLDIMALLVRLPGAPLDAMRPTSGLSPTPHNRATVKPQGDNQPFCPYWASDRSDKSGAWRDFVPGSRLLRSNNCAVVATLKDHYPARGYVVDQ
jgi:hypothetical protein